MKKRYLLDTNVLLRSPNALFVFGNNYISICHTTLEELDNLKNRTGETGYEAREAVRVINGLRSRGDLTKGVTLEDGGVVTVIADRIEERLLPVGWTFDKPDNRIIATAVATKSVLVTNDISLLIKAEAAGAKTETYRHEEASDSSINYKGRSTVYSDTEKIDSFYREGGLELSSLVTPAKLEVNEFVVIEDICNPKHTALGRYNGKYITKLNYVNSNPCDVAPKNVGQKFAIEALMTPASEIPLVILSGAAGTAKTFLSLAVGVHKVMNEEEYKKILLSRPNIKFDEDIGYLKGTEWDKILPLIRPCIDNLEALFHEDKKNVKSRRSISSASDYSCYGCSDSVMELFERNYITAEALAYIRGRSIHNHFMLIDEAQNSTPLQAMGIITRAGHNTKIVMAGDIEQIDNPKLDRKNNGLAYAADKMKGSMNCAQIKFEENECVRSPLAQEASSKLKM